MASVDPRHSNPLARCLRRLEMVMGADRGDRTLWVWVGPFATMVLIFGALVFFGAAQRVDLALTLPMALTMALFMGVLSAFYMSASSADEADGRDDDPPPAPAPLVRPPAPRIATQRHPLAPGPSAAARLRDREREPVGGQHP